MGARISPSNEAADADVSRTLNTAARAGAGHPRAVQNEQHRGDAITHRITRLFRKEETGRATTLAWFDAISPEKKDHHGHDDDDVHSTKWWKVPTIRFFWGDKQPELHVGAIELVMDLIFVGAAYRVGAVIKASISYCVVDGSSPSGSSSGSSALGSSGGSSSNLDECSGLGIG
eukprot:867464-Prymnesium_polylepis.1